MPLIVIAGKEYGSGSSRDWAAKGPRLLGVRAVIAESYERIHRSNLVGMGILPLQFSDGENAASPGPDRARRVFDIDGLEDGSAKTRHGHAPAADGSANDVRRPGCASIHRRRSNTIAMAGFCTMSCGNWPHETRSHGPAPP